MQPEYDAFVKKVVGKRTKIAIEFFGVFSRFEYALKRTGRVRGSGRARYAEADWDSFANSIKGMFLTINNEDFKQALSYLTKTPPRRQVLSRGSLNWAPMRRDPSDSTETYVLRLVRAVRNNFFHGGKYPTAVIDEPTRNKELLNACLVILKDCLELDTGLKNEFMTGL